ncbi:MAG TPA: hypothetical protein VMM82_01860 [Spirochaetia bacterium]|nr:hypothetical protein [Spirochaetia bacterium]
MKSCRLLLDDGLRGAAACMCVEMGCDVSVVDSAPKWPRQQKRVTQIDMPTLFYRALKEFAALRGASIEAVLRAWIDEHALPTVSPEGERIHERCRLMREWQGLGFTGKEPEVKYFARKLAGS